MPQKPIQFGNAQASGSDELGGAQPVSMNVIMEPTGAIRRRPGLRTHPSAPSSAFTGSLRGIHQALNGDIYTVDDAGAERPIYRVTGGAAAALGGGLPPSGLRGALYPTFAETEMLLVLAGGGVMQKIEFATLASMRLGGSPPEASHVIANSQRLLANDIVTDRTKVRYSSPAQGTATYAGHEEWLVGAGTAGFFTAEARPDPVVAIGETTNEVFVFGSQTTEVYAPEPTLRFQRISAQEAGVSAPASLVRVDGSYFGLDHQKRFGVWSGSGFEHLSEPIQRTLDGIADVSDCFGYRARIGPCDAVVWSFPSVGRTFAFQRNAGWGQWSGWNGNWTPFVVTGLTGADIVSTSVGRVGQLDFGTKDDFGQPIRAYVQSGYENQGTDAFKDCKRVLLALRRGGAVGPAGQQGSLWYRDRPGAWEFAGPIDLGGSGETDVVLEFPSLGTYRRRQWMFEYSGPDDLVLLSATEEYEVTAY